ncbi:MULTISPECIES: glycosyltransferase [unclassified Prevotella]|uniref:glycosyltransferase n=1 Tax=unclassified Prevotella TaxID=2638335 RepID=UPI00048DEB3D|nr:MULTISPECIES: glycosyltransferase [unclassified Prevotella]
MNILHIYPKNSELIQRHVQLLAEGLKQSANIMVADNNKSFYQQARDIQADLIHIHGINQSLQTKAMRCARKLNIRYVITLHGQLEPWAIGFQRANDRLEVLFSKKDYIEKAYAVITMGKMERESFQNLCWNPRIEEIRNAVTTNTITPAEMVSQTFAIYQKILDSNTLELMDEHTIKAMTVILKAGIMGDKRWVDTNEMDPRLINWRQLLLYAEHENISNYTDYGIRILGLSAPLIDTARIAAYFPHNYKRPQPIKELVGDYQGNQTDFLMRIIRQMLKTPTMLGIIELTRELYRENVNDEQLAEKMEEATLTKNAARLIQVLSEQVLLDEGYMPIPPLDDKATEKLRNNLRNHLKI